MNLSFNVVRVVQSKKAPIAAFRTYRTLTERFSKGKGCGKVLRKDHHGREVVASTVQLNTVFLELASISREE